MARSTEYYKNTAKVSGETRPLTLIEITQPSLVTPIRIVNDNVDIVSNGETFAALAFEITLPNNPITGATEASIQISNVGGDLTTWLENSAAQDTTVIIRTVLIETPDIIEYMATMKLTEVTATSNLVSGRLVYDNIYEKSMFPVRYNINSYPELFSFLLATLSFFNF